MQEPTFILKEQATNMKQAEPVTPQIRNGKSAQAKDLPVTGSKSPQKAHPLPSPVQWIWAPLEMLVFQFSPMQRSAPSITAPVAIKGTISQNHGQWVTPVSPDWIFVLGNKIRKYSPFSFHWMFQIGKEMNIIWLALRMVTDMNLVLEAHPETGIRSRWFVQELPRGNSMRKWEDQDRETSRKIRV